MLIGVGCDLIEIERVKKACDKEAFLSRIYTERERRQAKGDPRVLAGTFAVKEAVAKGFGTGFRATKIAEDLGITKIEVSISDTKDHAMAFAVGEGEAG